ncbi:hypothetical protein QR680_016796 [Steinernema hermaphroditum]|uniref:F-box domain-containing protein n=1 Tax=Steinernema hermaphroditum TaxID=289476 RepID=A0AA39HCR8_9BILA|nr:hypothetical protein QR680_016796 [Steinernema hermaphroditum]
MRPRPDCRQRPVWPVRACTPGGVRFRYRSAVSFRGMTIVGYLPPLPKSPAPPMAPIQTFDILELAKRSPSLSPRGTADENLFALLPDELLERIFRHCHLLDRIQLSHVCYRFHYLLTNGTSAISDLSLLNISEKSVWSSKSINCTKSRLSPIEVNDRSLANTVLRHCRVNENINVWYENLNFIEDVYYSLSKHRVKFRKISIYPHCKVIGLDILFRYLPAIQSVSIHPHGEQFAQEKVHLERLPPFHHLSELSLNSVTIGDTFHMPTTLTKLDFRNGNFDPILGQLPRLPRLRTLVIGNHEFSTSQFAQLCHAISEIALETLVSLLNVTINTTRATGDFSKGFYQSMSGSTIDADDRITVDGTLLGANLGLQLKEWLIRMSEPESIDDIGVGYRSRHEEDGEERDSDQLSVPAEHSGKSQESGVAAMVFKYCHFEVPHLQSLKWPRLKEFRLEQCYGPLTSIFHRVLPFCRETLKTLGIGVQSNDSDLPVGDIYALTQRLGACDAKLDLTLFQKRQQIERNGTLAMAPLSFATALSRLEISLIGEKELMDTLVNNVFPNLIEIKAVECSALSDHCLERISKVCPNLQKLSINECKHATVIGISHFLDHFSCRRSKELIIEWKSSRIQLSDYFKTLKDDQRVIGKLGVWYYSKRFNDENDGERIFVWEKNGDKKLSIQNYTSEMEGRQTLGLVVP